MDALSEMLRLARVSGGIFLRGEFTEPWCLASSIKASDCSALLGPTDHLILYHFVLEGALTVEVPANEPVTCQRGQAVILPRNDTHRLRGSAQSPAVSAFDVARIPEPGDIMMIQHGGGGAQTRIVCGFLSGPSLGDDPLISALPATLVYDGVTARSGPLMLQSMQVAAQELLESRPGSDAMLARLSELLFVEAVRAYIENRSQDPGEWLDGLRDRAVSRAVALIHRDLAYQWTVDNLARAVGASRSSLAERFRRFLDCAPAEYLTQQRMRRAAHLLGEDSRLPLIEIAEQVGYGSEAAFSRAFKRWHGVSPSGWR